MYYKVAEVRKAAQLFEERQYVKKSVASLVRDSAEFVEGREYDIFLSHSFSDAELILGVTQIIKAQGRTVYVDWIEDKALNRNL